MRREHDFPQPAGKDERAERRGDPPVQRDEEGETWVHIGRGMRHLASPAQHENGVIRTVSPDTTSIVWSNLAIASPSMPINLRHRRDDRFLGKSRLNLTRKGGGGVWSSRRDKVEIGNPG